MKNNNDNMLSRCINLLNRNKRSWKRVQGVFSKAYYKNSWGSSQSASGTGSELSQTRVLIQELPKVFRDLGIASVLDIPCGDFHWMREVDFQGVRYTGGDIVTPIVENNQRLYRAPGREFRHLNLIMDVLPNADLIFTRDCLVHFSFADIFQTLRNISRTEAKYFASTTFTARSDNADIPTGGWRVLNLEAPPFSLPPPRMIINEGCTEGEGVFTDKSIGIWNVDAIRACQGAWK